MQIIVAFVLEQNMMHAIVDEHVLSWRCWLVVVFEQLARPSSGIETTVHLASLTTD